MQIHNINSLSILSAAASSPSASANMGGIEESQKNKMPGMDALSSGEQTQDRDANEKYVPINFAREENLDGDQTNSLLTEQSLKKLSHPTNNTLPVLDFEAPATYEGWG
jgi:hypothetical protein